MKKIYIILCTTLIFSLTGCSRNVSVENRDFVDTIGIDLEEEGNETNIKVTLAIPDPSKIANGETEKVNQIAEISEKSFTKALKKADFKSAKRINVENVRVILIGEKLAKEKEYMDIIYDAIKRNGDISKRVIIVIAKGEASDILNEELEVSPIFGKYLVEYYDQNNLEITNAYDKKLSHLISKLNIVQNAILPQIYVEEGKLNMDEGVLFVRGEYIDTFDDDILFGYALIATELKNIVVEVDLDGTTVPIIINKKKSKEYFEERNGRLVYKVEQDFDCSLTEFNGPVSNDNLKKLVRLFNEEIENKINESFEYFVDKNNSDIYNLQEKLRQEDYELYKKYAQDATNVEFIRSLTLETDVKSRIISTGGIR